MAAAKSSQPTTSPAESTGVQTRSHGPSTLAVHGGRSRNPYQAVPEPVVQAATYSFENTTDLTSFMEARLWGNADGRTEYGRYGNPTVSAVEKKLATLDAAEEALLFASGMAAITSVLLAMLPTGTNLVITDDCYRRTREFCNTFLKRLGITCTVVPMGDYDALEAAIQPDTRLLLSESPTNPYLRTLDLVRFTEIARKHKVKSIIDATFATPLNIQPITYGVDLVVHSATKYLGGHNDLLAGVVTGEAGLIVSLRNALGVLGGVADPSNAALLLRGLKTLALRVEKQNGNGQSIAEFLEGHPSIEQVWYPGLPSHPDHQIAKRQMSGFGGVVSFTVRGDLEATSRFIDALQIPLIAASFGGVESLVEQPALMSFYELSTEERLGVGISDNLVRLSLGIEDAEDLIADLEQALSQI
ncbi:MAG: trans-sulfuration enzyme family protein [Anaerolineales bacterium]